MNKYENALVEILNGLGNYSLFPIEVKETVGYRTKYILSIPAETLTHFMQTDASPLVIFPSLS